MSTSSSSSSPSPSSSSSSPPPGPTIPTNHNKNKTTSVPPSRTLPDPYPIPDPDQDQDHPPATSTASDPTRSAASTASPTGADAPRRPAPVSKWLSEASVRSATAAAAPSPRKERNDGFGYPKRGLGYASMMKNAIDPCISCTTFNILAPIYKRLDKADQSRRESQYRAYWLSRNQSIIYQLLVVRSSIICLQEVWLGNEELVDMYDKWLGDAGYINLKLARTNNQGDGLLTAIHKDYFRVLNYMDLLFK